MQNLTSGNLQIVFLQNLQIYEFVNAVDFEKITLLMRKCMQYITSNVKCATKRHIEVRFLHCCISTKSHILANEEKAREVFLTSGIPLRLFSTHCIITFHLNF